MKRKKLGSLGEELAVKKLKNSGYKILARNFRSKLGEIDIIALDSSQNSKEKILVFVEVKTRWSQRFGSPEEAITPWKIRRIIKAGQYYRLLHPETPASMRIDAVTIDLFPSGKVKEIRLIKNLTL